MTRGCWVGCGGVRIYFWRVVSCEVVAICIVGRCVAGVRVELIRAVNWWVKPGSSHLVGGVLVLDSVVVVAVLVVSFIRVAVVVVVVLFAAVFVVSVIRVAVVVMVVLVVASIGGHPLCHRVDCIVDFIEFRLVIEELTIVTRWSCGSCVEVHTCGCWIVGQELLAIVVVG